MARLTTDARRTQLLELGLQLFSTRSYEEVAVDDIAAEAGISKGLLYHYFGGKREFYVACVHEATERLVASLDDDADVAPESRLREGLGRYLAFVEERADAYRSLMFGGLGADAEVVGILEDARARIVAMILQEVGLSTPRPVFRTAVRMWIGGVEAGALDWLTHRDVEPSVLIDLWAASSAAALAMAVQLDPEAAAELIAGVTD